MIPRSFPILISVPDVTPPNSYPSPRALLTLPIQPDPSPNKKVNSPPRNLPLTNRIIPHTPHPSLLTALTARQPLITPILAQSTAIAGADIAKVGGLPADLAPTRTISNPYACVPHRASWYICEGVEVFDALRTCGGEGVRVGDV